MSDTNLAPISLSAAKPYEGKAQTSAVGAAARKMIAAGWAVAETRWPDGKAQIRVTGRGRMNVPVADGSESLLQCVTLAFCTGAGATFDQVCAALRDAGWLVVPHKAAFLRNGNWLSADVIGPGASEWATDRKTWEDIAKARQVTEEAARQAAAETLKALAAEHGIEALVGRVSDYSDSVSIPYVRMVELIRTLTAQARP